MTRSQQRKVDSLFVSIGRLESKAMELKNMFKLTEQPVQAVILANVEEHLAESWRMLADAGLVK